MSGPRVGQTVGALRPRRTKFDLSYRTNFSCEMGNLVPVMFDEVVPGDYFDISAETVVRFQPLAAPIMHEVNVSVHYFFVPYRLLWTPTTPFGSLQNNWETFISQGVISESQIPIDGSAPPVTISLPRISYGSPQRPGGYTDNSNQQYFPPFFNESTPGVKPAGSSSYTELPKRTGLGTLWDYFGMPIVQHDKDIPKTNTSYDIMTTADPNPDLAYRPIDMPWRAYNFIYNEFYRDQDLQLPVYLLNGAVLNRNWRKDYFTCARPFLLKGQAPALPISIFSIGSPDSGAPGFQGGRFFIKNNVYASAYDQYVQSDLASVNGPITLSAPGSGGATGTGQLVVSVNAPQSQAADPDTTNGFATFGVNDLRLSTQLTKWMERNARGGTRYTEILRSHFGVSPTDARLDRPEYIGGSRAPVIISEVLQTSESQTTAQGNMSGHGVSATRQHVGKYNVQEYGLIMGLLSVMPKPSYQDGFNRQWLRKYPIDFYWPEFARLSEQAITAGEIRAIVTAGDIGSPSFPRPPEFDDRAVFGYQGQYDEMRTKFDIVCGDLRKVSGSLNAMLGPNYNTNVPNVSLNLSYWNLSRKFPLTFKNSLNQTMDPSPAPYLNTEFITCVPRKDIFLVQNIPSLIVNHANIIMATRPLPAVAEPGMLDHF